MSKIQNDCQLTTFSKINPKIESSSITVVYYPKRSDENRSTTIHIIPLTDKQMNSGENITSNLGR